jgi:glycosyltransferase involved in cell wall biosynthesis
VTDPTVSVIIPTRPFEPVITLASIMQQTQQPLEILIQVDQGHGQAWARNRAADAARGDYLLFSDADIHWRPTALAQYLRAALSTTIPEWQVAYAYGAYELHGPGATETLCDRPWNWEALKRHNFISTMVLIQREVFLKYRFDETFRRLEDWELWIRMGLDGFAGAYIGGVAFETNYRPDGVTFSGLYAHERYEQQLRAKLGAHLGLA